MSRNTASAPYFVELKETSSTNQYIKDHIENLKDVTVVYTDCQTAGRGSKGRSWMIEPGKGLALSVVFQDAPARILPTLPLVMGLSAAITLKKNGFDVSLKWPNDILLGGKKIAGLLCEGEWKGERGFVVCGIGLNLLQSAEDFQRSQLCYAGSILSQTGKHLDVDCWIKEFANQFWKDYRLLCQKGFSHFLSAYSEKCVTLGKELILLDHSKKILAKGEAIASDGRLICQTEKGTLLIHQADTLIQNNYEE